jgi:hypothetical protein
MTDAMIVPPRPARGPWERSSGAGKVLRERSTDRESAGCTYKIIRRNGSVVGLRARQDRDRDDQGLPRRERRPGRRVGARARAGRSAHRGVVNALMRRKPAGGTFHIEDIQDQVELALMRSGEHDVARAYVLYREERTQERARQKAAPGRPGRAFGLHVLDRGTWCVVRSTRPPCATLVDSACVGLGKTTVEAALLEATLKNLYDGVPIDEVRKSRHPVGPRADREGSGLQPGDRALLLHTIRREVLGEEVAQARDAGALRRVLPAVRRRGIEPAARREASARRVRPATTRPALVADRDLQFGYLGLQTLYDRYFLHIDEQSHRAAAGLLHAGGDGPGAERDRPRGARHRVLRAAVDLRLHELDADAVQRRHAALAAVVVLPDHRVRRPRRHLRGHQGERAAGQVRRRSGQRLDAGARAGRTSRAPTARARASCRS